MEHQHGKHVRVVCDLVIGGDVITEIHSRTSGKPTTITDIKWAGNTQTGFVVKTENYDRWHDSDWIERIDEESEMGNKRLRIYNNEIDQENEANE